MADRVAPRPTPTERGRAEAPRDELRDGLLARLTELVRRRRRRAATSSRARTSGSGSRPTWAEVGAMRPVHAWAPATSGSCRRSTGCRRRSAARWTPTSTRSSRAPRPSTVAEQTTGLRRRRHPLPGVRPRRPTSRSTGASRSRPTSATTNPAIDTWTKVYAGADWHERETYEMFGIDFVGHPGLRNIYLPADFEGNPAPQGLPAAGPHGEAVAGHRRRRAHARRATTNAEARRVRDA